MGAGILVIVRAVLEAGGVTGVSDWPVIGRAALDAAAVAAAGILQVALLAATTVTTQFGVGSRADEG
jgi:hypothetical protein